MQHSKSSFPLLFSIKKTLGFLEFQVMKLIWQKGKCSVRDVVEDLRKEKPFAYTTILTVMDHLYKKGFVKRVKIKKSYHYQPIASQKLFIKSSISKTFQNLLFEYGKIMVLTSVIPKLNPITAGFLTSLIFSLLTISLWDLLQETTFLDSVDLVKLIFLEPKIIFDHMGLLLGAFFEGLPLVSLLTNSILLIFTIVIVRKEFKFFRLS